MPGSDFLQLRPEQAPSKGLTTWLTDGLRTAITSGRLTPGDRLPPTRTLAAELAVSRGVVVDAYQRLTDEGLATAKTGAGTTVADMPAQPRRAMDRRPAAGLRLPLPPAAGIDIDLSPGVPDLSAFPRQAWLRAERSVLAGINAADLGYGDPGGSPVLRAELAGWLGRTRGVQATPDDIIVVNGVAQALALLAQVLTAGGIRRINHEDPGSRGARDQLTHWGLQTVPTPVDDLGVRVDQLSEPAAVLTPAHQFPTGAVLAPSRRREILEWAARGNLIIEDDYDAEHRYDRAPTAALQGSAPENVAYTGSVSKSLAPGMRLGWLIAPRHLQPALLAAKHASDLGNPGLPQLVLADLLRSGAYDRHLRLVKERQKKRRNALLAALQNYLPAADVKGIAAGLHLLLMLPGVTPDEQLAALAAAEGILVHPLSWHCLLPAGPGLVIGYAAHPPDRLKEATKRLATALTTASAQAGLRKP